MLTLQTLRDKGGVLLAVLIGIALLAFLLGDMLSSSSLLFGSSNKVGKIDGKSVSLQDYQSKLDYFSSLYGSNQNASDNASADAWDRIIRDELYTPQFEDLGLGISAAEAKSLLSPENPSLMIQNFFAQQFGYYSPDDFRKILESASYDPTGTNMRWIAYLKAESEFMSSLSKLEAELRGGYYPTQLDVDFAVNNLSKSRNVRYIYKKIQEVSDSVISFTDNDVKNYYEAHKNYYYKKEETRKINYVTFDVNPSEDDFIAAQKKVDQMAEKFAVAEDARAYADANSSDKSLSHYYSRGQLDTELAEFAFSGNTGVYRPAPDGRTFTMARVIKVRNVMDSIQLSRIVLQPNQNALADSLMDVLAKDGDFAGLAMQYSADAQTRDVGGQLGMMDPATLPIALFDKVVDLPKGKCVKFEYDNLIHIFKVEKTVGNQPKAYIAFVTYQVEPSKVTRNAVFNRATKFATNAAGGIDRFLRTGSDSVLDLRVAQLHPADRGVEGIDNSHEIVTWAFAKGDEEGTSSVMEFGDMFLVAALASVEPQGITPLDDVREEIVGALKVELKSDYLRKLMSGSSLQEVADRLDLEVFEANDVDFNTTQFPGIGFNPALAGGLASVKTSTLSNPIVANSSFSSVVVLAEVVSENENEIDADQYRQLLKANAEQYMLERVISEMVRKAEIADQRYKFYR